MCVCEKRKQNATNTKADKFALKSARSHALCGWSICQSIGFRLHWVECSICVFVFSCCFRPIRMCSYSFVYAKQPISAPIARSYCAIDALSLIPFSNQCTIRMHFGLCELLHRLAKRSSVPPIQYLKRQKKIKAIGCCFFCCSLKYSCFWCVYVCDTVKRWIFDAINLLTIIHSNGDYFSHETDGVDLSHFVRHDSQTLIYFRKLSRNFFWKN